MKKFNLLHGAQKLTKEQMKNVVGGQEEDPGTGDCRLGVTQPGIGFYWTARNYSVADAQANYNAHTQYNDGSYCSAYCCDSCPY